MQRFHADSVILHRREVLLERPVKRLLTSPPGLEKGEARDVIPGHRWLKGFSDP